MEVEAAQLDPMESEADRLAAQLLARPETKGWLETLRRTDAETLADQRQLTEIPAPPFQEQARGAHMAELMRAAGLQQVGLDDEGNVVGVHRPAGRSGARAPLLVAAHLDTVFPPGTDVRVRAGRGVLRAPGIADNGRGLAGMLALARALGADEPFAGRPVWMVATVGEEGPGNLRGVRHLFGPGGLARTEGCAGFVALDGAGTRTVVHTGVGSTRHRLTVTGPGGHSWSDWGRPNPVTATAAVALALARLPGPAPEPRVTVNVGRVGGGTSVNSIPEESWLEFEVRSADAAALARMSGAARHAVDGVLAGEGGRGLTWRLDALGERPAGQTDPEGPLVQAAVAATHATGFVPQFVASSTDANVPMSLGVPALTLGAGGEAGGMHTLAEWYRNTHGAAGIGRVLLTLLVADALL